MSEAGINQNHSPSMQAAKVFQILGAAVTNGSSARLGRLSFPGRRPIDTPNYTVMTSRGVVPHLTPDNFDRYTSVGSAYLALEDFIEKQDPPIYGVPYSEKPRLHSFTGLPSDRTTILGARKCPHVLAPMGNAAKTLQVFTSTGFASVSVSSFASAVETLQPDVVLPLSDSLHRSVAPSSKKLVKTVERTEEWLAEFIQLINSQSQSGKPTPSVFAPVLPVEYPIQWAYLKHLAEDVLESLAGLAIYNVDLLSAVADYPTMVSLPRLSMDPPKSPHEVLRQISLGVDMCALNFVNDVSNAGVALTFKFPPQETGETLLPLGTDMWSPEHCTSLTPFSEGCQCSTCSRHSRAYLHHLLNAREMLGWNLLQIHNHQVLSDFFNGVRQSLQQGRSEFNKYRELFSKTYEADLPAGTGERPRARGYHFKSAHGQEKINKPGWGKLGGGDEVAPAQDPTSEASSLPTEAVQA